MRPSRSLILSSYCPLLLFTIIVHEFSPITACVDSDDTSDDVDWKTPAPDATCTSGESFVVQFNSDQCTASPAIQLCNCDTGCGEWIWPDFKQNSDLSLSATLQLPNVTDEGNYFLKMKDDSGDCGSSPRFSISPFAASQQGPSVAASSSNISPESSSTALPISTENEGLQSPMTAPPSAPSSDSTSVVTPMNSTMNSTPPMATSTPNLLATRIPPPTAAFAVPLSIVGAILLIAGGVFLRHSRKLNEERAKEVEKLKSELNSMSRNSSYTSFCSRRVEKDLERGLESSDHDMSSYGPMPVPVFMPMAEIYDPGARRFTRKAYSDFHPASMAYGYPHDPQSRAHRSPRSNTVLSSFSFQTTESRSHPTRRLSFPPSDKQNQQEQDDDYGGHTVTGFVIADYLGSEEQGRPEQVPPECLLAAPQRLHMRDQIVRESDSFQEIDLYDAVANSLQTYRNNQ